MKFGQFILSYISLPPSILSRALSAAVVLHSSVVHMQYIHTTIQKWIVGSENFSSRSSALSQTTDSINNFCSSFTTHLHHSCSFLFLFSRFGHTNDINIFHFSTSYQFKHVNDTFSSLHLMLLIFSQTHYTARSNDWPKTINKIRLICLHDDAVCGHRVNKISLQHWPLRHEQNGKKSTYIFFIQFYSLERACQTVTDII